MKRSTDRIRTTHTGSLPRPPEILQMMHAKWGGTGFDAEAFEKALTRNVADIVKHQIQCGIDVVNDGECSKPSFQGYVAERLGGFESRIPPGGIPVPTGPMGPDGRDAQMFPDFYKNVLEHNPFIHTVRIPPQVCIGPIAYIGQAHLKRDISNLKSAMAAAGADEGFLPAAAPFPRMKNEHYTTEDEFFFAFGEAMRTEYQAILDAGLLLQIDFPSLVSTWDDERNINLSDYRKWAEARIEILNHTLRGLPADRIRFHTCYGVNFGPRLSDLQLDQVIDLFFKINAGSYSFEAANPRHEHEWRVLQKVKLPEGKIVIPGVVTHSNVMVEHEAVVPDRIERWAQTAGRENVLVGNDCGFQSTAGNTEIQMTVAWAKLKALGDGAKLASKHLWAH